MCSTPFISAVMIHVANVAEGIAWYLRAFPSARLSRVHKPEFEFLTLGSVRLEIVLADTKVSSGACGTVVYWQVANFEAALGHLQAIGATRYRGPIDIEGGERMCQVRDPWGNCIGLCGPSRSPTPAT